jgi:hypothetical protein
MNHWEDCAGDTMGEGVVFSFSGGLKVRNSFFGDIEGKTMCMNINDDIGGFKSKQ